MLSESALAVPPVTNSALQNCLTGDVLTPLLINDQSAQPITKFTPKFIRPNKPTTTVSEEGYELLEICLDI
jgi:hypothetical protein